MFSTVKLTLYQACRANKRQQLKDLSTMYIRHLGTQRNTQQQQNTTKKELKTNNLKCVPKYVMSSTNFLLCLQQTVLFIESTKVGCVEFC